MRQYLLTCELARKNYQDAVRRLKLLPQRIMLRAPIQWDSGKQEMDDPRDYVDAFRALSEVADVMIQFVDSSAMMHFSPGSLEEHVEKCLDTLGNFCRVAEAGNEVNGDWLGTDTAAKVERALKVCKRRNLMAAVTYYLSADEPQQMFKWIDDNPLASELTLISYYPNSTPGIQVDPAEVFAKFADRFPESMIGWGEYGTQNADSENKAPMRERAAFVRKFEREYWDMLAPLFSNYAGFGGYWDWQTDRKLDGVFAEVWK